MSTYTWTFNATGLEVTITIDPEKGTATIKALKGSLDVNALWFSDGDTIKEGTTTLKNPSLNMNGSASQGITWDSVAELSPPGLGRNREIKKTYLVEGEEQEFTLGELGLDKLDLTQNPEQPIDYSTLIIGLRATSVNGNGSVKLVDKTGEKDNDDTFTDGDEIVSTQEDTELTGNVLANASPDPTGDGPLAVTSFSIDGVSYDPGTVASIAGVGELTIASTGAYSFTPAPDYTGPVPLVTYEVSDGFGPTDTSTLTITIDQADDTRLIVGSSSDDKEESTAKFTVVDTVDRPLPQDFGAIIGGDADDILIGDVGGTEKNVKPGEDYNIALVVDGSGSMVGRLGLLKESLINLATDLADHDGKINLTLISFANSASERITITDFGSDTLEELEDAINALTANGATNYESAFNLATGWFADPAKANAGYNNQTYFVTDGDPTLYINGDGLNAGTGNTTDYATMLNSVEAFQPLALASSVYGIGIIEDKNDENVNVDLLRFFDTTDITGSATQTFSLGYNSLAGFTNGGSASGINSASDWNVTGSGSGGGSKAVVNNTGTTNDYLVLRDARDSGTQAASVFTSPAFSVSTGGRVRFRYRAANSNLGDTIRWELVNGGTTVVSSGTLSRSQTSFTTITTPTVSSTGDDYRLRFTVLDGSSAGAFELRVDDIQVGGQTVSGPVGEAAIVRNADELTAALIGGSETTELLPAANDSITGGGGDDLIFGDVLFTDLLASEKGLSTPDGSGWLVFEELENPSRGVLSSTGEQWVRQDTINYILNNQDIIGKESPRDGSDDQINGGEGNDRIYGQEGNDRIEGGPGADWISGGSGADQFLYREGDGSWTDTISDFTSGSDKIIFINASSFEIRSVNESKVTFRVAWLNGQAEDVTIDFLANASTVKLTDLGSESSPISIDLDRDGSIAYLSLPAITQSAEDPAVGGGFTGWTAPSDGLLAYDYNADGLITEAREFVFTLWGTNPEVTTDMQALAAYFDSNTDGLLNSLDDGWSQFGVWQDLNSDGVQQDGEFRDLASWGIDSIALSYNADSQAYRAAAGDVQVFGQMAVGYSDGSTGLAEDVAFSVAASTSEGPQTSADPITGIDTAPVALMPAAVAADPLASPSAACACDGLTGFFEPYQAAQAMLQPLFTALKTAWPGFDGCISGLASDASVTDLLQFYNRPLDSLESLFERQCASTMTL